MSNCEILNFINNKKALYNKYNYVFVDVSSLTITPYLNLEKNLSMDRINITPFIETIKFYINLKQVLPQSKFIFTFDGGISINIKKIYPEYKLNRSKSKRTKGVFDWNTKNLYDYNCLLLTEIFGLLNEVVVPSNLVTNEADFVIGYFLKKLKDNNIKQKSLVISHDKDYLMAFDENNTDVIYKYTAPNKGSKNFLIKNIDCICDIIDFPYLKNISEFILYKALMGDSSDNIKKPFGIKSKTIFENFFRDCYLDDIDVTYDSILQYFSKKFKTPQILSKFEKEFRRNLYICNIFNDDIISELDKVKLNKIFDDIIYPKDNKIQINSIQQFIKQYGLMGESDSENLFKYLQR